jgi:hypothetical protein
VIFVELEEKRIGSISGNKPSFNMSCKGMKNNYKVLNLITTPLGRSVYDIVAHLETAHDV